MLSEIAITIKPTLSCNMRCRHCFNGDDLKSSEIIDISKVLRVLETACREYKEVKITFHGGEPSLVGIDFYNKFFDFKNKMHKEHGSIFHIFFTTNGLALNDEMIDLLIKNNVLINISFDGPYNDVLRQNGEQVLINIRKAQLKHARMRVFCTLSKDSITHLFEIYEWFKINNLDFKTLPIEKRGYARENESLIMDSEILVNELVKVYRYWIKDKDCKIRYYTFEEFAGLRRDTQFTHFWFNRKIALNPDGKLYPFGRPNDVKFCLGDAKKISCIEDCFKSNEYKRLLTILYRYRDSMCSRCDSLSICNGLALCTSFMYVDNEDLINYSCRQSNKIFCSILKVNDEIIMDFQKGNINEYSNVIKRKFAEFIKPET